MNPLLSMACLKFIYDEKNDYVEALGEFVIELIAINPKIKITPSSVRKSFEAEFGLEIPHIPMQKILTGMAKRGFLKRSRDFNQEFRKSDTFPKTSIIKNKHTRDLENAFSTLLTNFIEFAKDISNRQYSSEEAEKILLLFFDNKLLNRLQNNFGGDDLKFLGDTTKDELIIASLYIEDLEKSKPELSDIILSIAVGNLIVSTLIYRDFIQENHDKYNCHCYLDTPIIFEIIGVNLDVREEAYSQFLELLWNQGFKLYVFEHVYDEVFNILNSCKQWVGNPAYDPIKASRATRFFRNEGHSVIDIDHFIIQAKQKLKILNIEMRPVPSSNELTKFQVDVELLEKKFKEKYTPSRRFSFPDETKETIDRDIRSIEAMYKLRKRDKPTNFREVKNIMVTTNASLIKICADFHHEEMGFISRVIPVFTSDLALGTIVWLSSVPKVLESFAKAKLISRVLSIIEPSPDLLNALSDQINKKINSNQLMEDEAKLLLESYQSRLLLTQYTLGDAERVNDQTPFEILKTIENNLNKDIKNQLDEYKEREKKLRLELLQRKSTDDFYQKEIMGKAKAESILKTFLFFSIPLIIYVVFILIRVKVINLNIEPISKVINVYGNMVNLFLALTGVSIVFLAIKKYVDIYKKICTEKKIKYITPKIVEKWTKFNKIE